MTRKPYTASMSLPDFSLWDKLGKRERPLSFDLEVTARCNLRCRHCYINLPAGDKTSQKRELSLDEIGGIADQAASLGCLWCLITGGEPMLRSDFADIYLLLRKKGFLVSVFTNATLLTPEHITLFKTFPPRDIEVSVYGVTPETYEKVTGKKGAFKAFRRGIDLLFNNGIKVRFKTMALKSNVRELPDIARFCRERTIDYFRFDPFLHARFDGDPFRNEEIRQERLSPREIVDLELSDPERFQALEKECGFLVFEGFDAGDSAPVFHCGAGRGSFSVGYDGQFRLCQSLCHPDCIYNLRQGSLADAWFNFVPRVLAFRSVRKAFLEKCLICPIINLCMWCPANAHLETGELDLPVDDFCSVACARSEILKKTFETN